MQSTNIMIEGLDITAGTTDIRRIITEYYRQFNAKNFNHLDEMGK